MLFFIMSQTISFSLRILFKGNTNTFGEESWTCADTLHHVNGDFNVFSVFYAGKQFRYIYLVYNS